MPTNNWVLERLQTLNWNVSPCTCGALGPPGPPPPPPPPGAGVGLNCAWAVGTNPSPNAQTAIASADFQALMGDTPSDFSKMPRSRDNGMVLQLRQEGKWSVAHRYATDSRRPCHAYGGNETMLVSFAERLLGGRAHARTGPAARRVVAAWRPRQAEVLAQCAALVFGAE